MILWLKVPETLHYLTIKGEWEKAKEVLTQVLTKNKGLELTQVETQRIEDGLSNLKS
jgi:hypothetical protein